MDIDGLADLLLAGEGHFDDRSAGDLHVGFIDRVEAFFFDMNLVLAGGKGGKLAASVEIGQAVESRLGGGWNGDSGIADGDSSVVDYDDHGWGRGLGRRRADQDESDQGSTHAVVDILIVRMRWDGGWFFAAVWERFAGLQGKAWTAEDAENFRRDR